MSKYAVIGKEMYDLKKRGELHRYIVFRIRCALYPHRMKKIEEFFTNDDLMAEVARLYPFVYEIPTRAFFFNKSKFEDRLNIIKQHMSFLTSKLQKKYFLDLYNRQEKILWQSNDEGEPLHAVLWYHAGQRKEGLLSVVLKQSDKLLYQMMFWIAKDKNDEWSMWIGAMQGPNMENARDIIKKVTKRCHSYRTKNLILHISQEVAKGLGLKHIYAVTNYGYYANNHIRRDRKLKTDFSQFWQESGGTPCKDLRFFELPLKEHRKTMEEIPTRKRANYRKRFQMLDEIDEAILANVKRLMK